MNKRAAKMHACRITFMQIQSYLNADGRGDDGLSENDEAKIRVELELIAARMDEQCFRLSRPRSRAAAVVAAESEAVATAPARHPQQCGRCFARIDAPGPCPVCQDSPFGRR